MRQSCAVAVGVALFALLVSVTARSPDMRIREPFLEARETHRFEERHLEQKRGAVMGGGMDKPLHHDDKPLMSGSGMPLGKPFMGGSGLLDDAPLSSAIGMPFEAVKDDYENWDSSGSIEFRGDDYSGSVRGDDYSGSVDIRDDYSGSVRGDDYSGSVDLRDDEQI